MMNFLEVIVILLLKNNFDMGKNIRGFSENLFEYYFLYIIVVVNFFSDLRFEYYCEYYLEILLLVSLNKNLDGRAHEIFRSIVSWTTNFSEKFVKPFGAPITY